MTATMKALRRMQAARGRLGRTASSQNGGEGIGSRIRGGFAFVLRSALVRSLLGIVAAANLCMGVVLGSQMLSVVSWTRLGLIEVSQLPPLTSLMSCAASQSTSSMSICSTRNAASVAQPPP